MPRTGLVGYGGSLLTKNVWKYWEHGAAGLMVGLMIFKVFSNSNNSSAFPLPRCQLLLSVPEGSPRGSQGYPMAQPVGFAEQH